MAGQNALVRAGGFILFRRTPQSLQYLLMQTSYGQHHWTPPKGHVDPGETDFEAALRETEEEAGLVMNKDFSLIEDFKVELRYDVVSHKDGVKRPKLVTYWLGQMLPEGSEVKLSHEHQAYQWLPLSEACTLISAYQDMIDALNKCEAKLKSM